MLFSRVSFSVGPLIGRWLGAGVVSVAALAVGCSAGDDVSGGGPGDGNGQNGGGIGLGNGEGGEEVDLESCQTAEINFEPKTPTVYVLVDRSGSMADEGFWGPLRTNLLTVVQELQAQTRFGFGSYTGTSGSCTGLDDLGTIALSNYDAIAAEYNSLSPMMNGETPTALAVQQAADVLTADEGPGSDFILLVTDGNPDFCDNGQDTCAQDALIGTLQETYQAGIQTLVFGLQAQAFPIEDGTLDRYANAGSGGGVTWDKGVEDGNGKTTIEYECSSPVWQEFTDGDGPAGTYSDTSGDAQAFSSQDVGALVDEISSALVGLKSCTLDLSDDLKVRAGQEKSGTISIGDMELPEDQWTLDAETEVLELMGAGCDLWKNGDSDEFKAEYPCDSLVK